MLPENSIDAFMKAVDLKVPGIELDIQWLTDGAVAVWHDETPGRFFIPPDSGPDAPIRSLDTRELKALVPRDENGHPGIPLLSEVFEALQNRIKIDIEIKYYELPASGQLTGLMDMIENSGMTESCIVSSFDPRILMAWKQTGSPVPCGLIFDPGSKSRITKEAPWEQALSICDFEKPEYTMTEDIAGGIGRGRTVIPWTVDDAETGMELIDKGVRGIITNTPQSYRRLLTRSSAINFPS